MKSMGYMMGLENGNAPVRGVEYIDGLVFHFWQPSQNALSKAWPLDNGIFPFFQIRIVFEWVIGSFKNHQLWNPGNVR